MFCKNILILIYINDEKPLTFLVVNFNFFTSSNAKMQKMLAFWSKKNKKTGIK